MPRRNPPRSVFAEEHLAANIARLRISRGWTYDGLARRMADVGCPIDQSAIYKIEKGKPRRKTTVDELVAFAAVFELPLDEMVADPAVRVRKDVMRALKGWHAAETRLLLIIAKHREQSKAFADQVRDLAALSPQVSGFLDEYLRRDESTTGSGLDLLAQGLAAELKGSEGGRRGKRR